MSFHPFTWEMLSKWYFHLVYNPSPLNGSGSTIGLLAIPVNRCCGLDPADYASVIVVFIMEMYLEHNSTKTDSETILFLIMSHNTLTIWIGI